MNRTLALTGCANFRDLGGYAAAGGSTVRWTTVYRADGLHELTDDDHARIAERGGLATVFDLRTLSEVQTYGSVRAVETMRYRHVSLFAEPADGPAAVAAGAVPLRPPVLDSAGLDARAHALGAGYVATLRSAAPKIGSILADIAKPDCGPSVFHCSMGRDRTGITAAVLLATLGVADDVIVEDYLTTILNLGDRIAGWFVELGTIDRWEPPAHGGDPWVVLEHAKSEGVDLGVYPEAIRAVLAALRADAGSAQAWAAQQGVAVEALRERLLV